MNDNQPIPDDNLPVAKKPISEILFSFFMSFIRISAKTLHTAFKSLLVLSLAAIMAWVNFTVDVSGYYHSNEYEKSAALKMIAGENLADYDSLQDRVLNAFYAENLTEKVDVLALGSSRIKQLNHDIVGTTSFYNAGVSGADFYDILGTFYLFERSGNLPKTLIIGLDAWLLNINEGQNNYKSDKELYNEFLSVAFGIKTDYIPKDPAEQYKPLFDVAYFQGNIKNYFKYGPRKNVDEPLTVPTEDVFAQKTNVLMSDGSVVYDEDFRNNTPEEVNAAVRAEASTFWGADGFYELDPTRCELFEKFIEHVQALGINIVFILAPYNPQLYIYSLEKHDLFPGFSLAQPWYINTAEKYNVPIFGSYNPLHLELNESKFYDGLHVKHEGLAEIMPTLEQIEQARSAKNATSEWMKRNDAILYETAEYVVSERNAIPANQSLVQGNDTTIAGEPAYVILRYSGTAESSTLLARYAFTKNDGLMYRFDTQGGGWTYDNWF